MSKVKPLREEHADATRRSLLDVARILFTERGFAATSLDQIAERARLTKGAVYHHFENKRDLFKAVYAALAAEVEARIRRDMGDATDPFERARLAVESFLACADDPAVRAVMFRDGLPVLVGECRAIDDLHYLGLLRELLDDLVAAGFLAGADTAVLSRLLLSMLIEASAMLGADDAPRAAVRASLERIVMGLITLPGG